MRTAIVTGSSRNIGRAVARELAGRGLAVVANGASDSDALRSVVAQLEREGVNAVGVPGDVRDPATVRRLLGAARELGGGPDVLVHVPAIRPVQPFLEITAEDWHHVMSVNLGSLFHLAQAVLPWMLERSWGRIVGFSGARAVTGHRTGAHVVASKAGVVGLIRGIAYEYADRGVTANVVVPGVIDTARAAAFEVAGGRTFEATQKPAEHDLPPVGRLGTPQEIGQLCAYLASDEAAFVTGQSLHINGGSQFY